MHWAALVLPPVLAVVVVAGVAFYQHMQLREQEEAYWGRRSIPYISTAGRHCMRDDSVDHSGLVCLTHR